jgi:hypothetical protein
MKPVIQDVDLRRNDAPTKIIGGGCSSCCTGQWEHPGDFQVVVVVGDAAPAFWPESELDEVQCGKGLATAAT